MSGLKIDDGLARAWLLKWSTADRWPTTINLTGYQFAILTCLGYGCPPLRSIRESNTGFVAPWAVTRAARLLADRQLSLALTAGWRTAQADMNTMAHACYTSS